MFTEGQIHPMAVESVEAIVGGEAHSLIGPVEIKDGRSSSAKVTVRFYLGLDKILDKLNLLESIISIVLGRMLNQKDEKNLTIRLASNCAGRSRAVPKFFNRHHRQLYCLRQIFQRARQMMILFEIILLGHL